MRISDWSSDVCSSDLITKANQAAVALFGADDAAALTGPVAKVFAASPETARLVMIARFKGQRTYAEVMKMRTLDGRLLDVRITITYPAPPERLDVTLICLEDLTDQRSEEHTSELQSLMRISYAVFCLKKTTNQPQLD